MNWIALRKFLLVGVAALLLLCSGGIAQASITPGVLVDGPPNPEVPIGGLFTVDLVIGSIGSLTNLDAWNLGVELSGTGGAKFASWTNVSTEPNYVFFGNTFSYGGAIDADRLHVKLGDLTNNGLGVATVAGKLLARISIDMSPALNGEVYALSLYGPGTWSFFMDKDGNQESGLSLSYQFHTPTAVPIPGAVWLLGSGLVGLFGLRRKLG